MALLSFILLVPSFPSFIPKCTQGYDPTCVTHHLSHNFLVIVFFIHLAITLSIHKYKYMYVTDCSKSYSLKMKEYKVIYLNKPLRFFLQEGTGGFCTLF